MSILSNNQKNILSLLAKEKIINNNFYLSGGTALAEFYLNHRLSEDLDFFSEKEFDGEAISATFKKNLIIIWTRFNYLLNLSKLIF